MQAFSCLSVIIRHFIIKQQANLNYTHRGKGKVLGIFIKTAANINLSAAYVYAPWRSPLKGKSAYKKIISTPMTTAAIPIIRLTSIAASEGSAFLYCQPRLRYHAVLGEIA